MIDAQAFMQKLNEREGVVHYRLPTEAQWEYACRAMSRTIYHIDDDKSQLGDYAWYWENSNGQTHPVGQKKPNAWGLYDMLGNVYEWVQDWYGYYQHSPRRDPQGPDSGFRRVYRGGSWCTPAQYVMASGRGVHYVPGVRSDLLGFRCMCLGHKSVLGA